MAKAKVPEDAFYTNPFGIDEGDDVEMNDQNHDMFCSFTYLRARFTCTTAGDGTFMYQWFPMFSKYGLRSSVGPTNVWNDGDMPWSTTVQNNFSHYRILGAAMKVIPIASSDNTQGQALGGSIVGAGTRDQTNLLGTAAVVDALYRDWETDRKSTRLNSSHSGESRMPSSA